MKNQEVSKARRAWDWTKNDSELADIHGMSPSNVRRIRKQLGMADALNKGRVTKYVDRGTTFTAESFVY